MRRRKLKLPLVNELVRMLLNARGDGVPEKRHAYLPSDTWPGANQRASDSAPLPPGTLASNNAASASALSFDTTIVLIWRAFQVAKERSKPMHTRKMTNCKHSFPKWVGVLWGAAAVAAGTGGCAIAEHTQTPEVLAGIRNRGYSVKFTGENRA